MTGKEATQSAPRRAAPRRRGAGRSLSALDRQIAVDQALRRLGTWLLPALALSLSLNAVQGVMNAGLLIRGPEQLFFQFAPTHGDAMPITAIPIAPLSEPLTPQRLSGWTTEVVENLFDFSHADYADHFRRIRIYFTAGGFQRFREMMVTSNWLSQVQGRRAVLRGEVDGALRVARVSPELDYWDMDGRVHIVLDSPGHEVATDTKRIMLRVVRGESIPPADPLTKPFPATNWIGLRIDVLSVSD